MQRPIKFRVWDKLFNKMFQVEQLYFENGKTIIPHYISKEPRIKNQIGNAITSIHNEDNFELMQFTGLFDINGKEIYEGDILKAIDESFGEVKYGEFHQMGLRDCERFGWHYSYFGLNSIKDISQFSIAIIGNIHENPDLLTNQGE